MYPEALKLLIEEFERLPGVGKKSAVRLAFHVMNMDKIKAERFAKTIVDAKEKVHLCPVCQNLTDKEKCPICESNKRNSRVICVVEGPKDIIAMEKTHEFTGLYHCLHGVISPMDNIGPEDIKLRELLARLTGDVEEIILATNLTVEGEATAMYIARMVKPLGVKVTRIAHGIPVGGDIEFADEVTLARAIEGRREI